ncbi:MULTISPECIES: hypothetical protein [Myxococcus]|uniref:hypothetical protein n=1 Tax=Myxococcus TaxID=32 RepID=UPI00138F9EDE|nr:MULTISPECIES: hypothetical protein [Myxococcus]NOK04662.1 hypothetical protein [Myxococcus xanthus]
MADLDSVLVELEAAASQMGELARRLEDASAFYEEHKLIPRNHQVAYSDMLMTEQISAAALKKAEAIHPGISEQWIPVTDQQIRVTLIDGLATHFGEKYRQLQHAVAILKYSKTPPPTRKSKNKTTPHTRQDPKQQQKHKERKCQTRARFS